MNILHHSKKILQKKSKKNKKNIHIRNQIIPIQFDYFYYIISL